MKPFSELRDSCGRVSPRSKTWSTRTCLVVDVMLVAGIEVVVAVCRRRSLVASHHGHAAAVHAMGMLGAEDSSAQRFVRRS